MKTPQENIHSDERNLLGCERLGKLLFVRVDPILRNLLAVIQQHQELSDGAIASNETRGQPQGPEREERILGLLKAESELLMSLQEVITDFPSRHLLQEMSQSRPLLKQELAASVAVMMDYLSLPMAAIFQRPSISVKDLEASAEDVRRKLQIRQSAEWKSIARAARTLKICLDILEKGKISCNSAPKLMPPSKAVQLMIACSSALPSGREIALQTTNSFANVGLDRGENHIGAILDTITCLLRVCGARTEEGNLIYSLGDEIARALDGALVAHLADSCVSIVAPPSAYSPSVCLQACQMLDTLINRVDDISMWRSLFPGLFAGLFRCLIVGLRGVSNTPQSTPEVLVAGLKTLSTLLQSTLRNDIKTSQENNAKVEMGLAGLKALAQSSTIPSSGQIVLPERQTKNARKVLGASSDSSRNQTLPTVELTEKDNFLQEINSRLPGPLTALCNLLVTAQAESVRRQAPYLYQIIMNDTRPSWNREVLEKLSTTSLECCFILSKDDAGEVSSLSRSVLEVYKKTPAFNNDMKTIILPRILSMLESLPALAQGTNNIELINRMKLVTAFLELNTRSEMDSGGWKSLRSSLASENVSCSVRRALSALLDIDFESPEAPKVGPIEVFDRENGPALLSQPFRQKRLRFLTPKAEKEATAMFRELGSALGIKHSAVFVDRCIADLFGDCLSRLEMGTSRCGGSQVSWCHEWIGCLAVIRELLHGAFGFNREQSTQSSVSKSDRKRRKHLKSLANSVVPFIVSPPLWDLPTSFDGSTELENMGGNLVHEDSLACATTRGHGSTMPVALRGNSYFLSGLIQILVSFVELLGEEASTLLPTILLPSLEMAATGNTNHIQHNANRVLVKLAVSVGYKNVACMVEHKIDVISGALFASLRVPSVNTSVEVQKEKKGALHVARVMRYVLGILNAESEKIEIMTRCDRSSLPYIIELVSTLTERFDYLPTRIAQESYMIHALLEVYVHTLSFLVLCYEDIEINRDSSMKPGASSSAIAPWLEALTSFRRLSCDDGSDELDKIDSPKEGFEFYRNKNRSDLSTEDSEKSSNELSGDHRVSQREINFVAILVARCSFFLSNSSLKLQVSSCTAMAQGFRFLAIVARLCKKPDDDKGTAIRRQVSNSWSAIMARLRAMVTEIQASRGTSVIIFRQQDMAKSFLPTTDVATKRVFLSKLLDLVSVMAQCSGDFMASRFKNDVFPAISPLLGSFVGDQTKSETHDDMRLHYTAYYVRHERSTAVTSRQQSEVSLIVSMLRCLYVVFQPYACSRSLVGLIPAVGTLVLPFLDEESEIGEACEDAVKAMAQIDCDALWRPLVQLSGRSFPPPRPWKRPANDDILASSQSQSSPGRDCTLLVSRAKLLVDFIDSLPEQPL